MIAAIQAGGGVRVALVVVDGVVALTALGGGVALVLGLEAERFGPEWLEERRFGVIWFRAYSSRGCRRKRRGRDAATIVGWHGGLLSALAGLVLVGWIVGEVAILDQPSPTRTEGVYLVAGLLILALAGAFTWT